MQILICNLGREFCKNGEKDNSASINLILVLPVILALIPLALIYFTPLPRAISRNPSKNNA